MSLMSIHWKMQEVVPVHKPAHILASFPDFPPGMSCAYVAESLGRQCHHKPQELMWSWRRWI